MLSNLAETMRQEGNIKEATELFQRCYSHEAATNSPESLACSMFANNVAVCLRAQDRNTEAQYFYERAVKGLTHYYGKDHEKVQVVAKNLKELTSGSTDATPAELPKFLMAEPRKPDECLYSADEQFMNKPMCNFPNQ